MSCTRKDRAASLVDAWSCAIVTDELSRGLPKWATLGGLQNLIETALQEQADAFTAAGASLASRLKDVERERDVARAETYAACLECGSDDPAAPCPLRDAKERCARVESAGKALAEGLRLALRWVEYPTDPDYPCTTNGEPQREIGAARAALAAWDAAQAE